MLCGHNPIASTRKKKKADLKMFKFRAFLSTCIFQIILIMTKDNFLSEFTGLNKVSRKGKYTFLCLLSFLKYVLMMIFLGL